MNIIQLINTNETLFQFISLGACNESSSSPIKGYRKVPNGSKFIRSFKRRKGCMAVPVPEKRTTMMCNTCRGRLLEPNRQPKQRYRTCHNCKPRMDLEILPATSVITHMSPRKLQREREKRRLEMQQQQALIAQQQPDDEDVVMQPIRECRYGPYRPLEMPRPRSITSKIATYVQTDSFVDAKNTRNRIWNRDVNAGRNILCIGEYFLFFLIIFFQIGFFLSHSRTCTCTRNTDRPGIYCAQIGRPRVITFK